MLQPLCALIYAAAPAGLSEGPPALPVTFYADPALPSKLFLTLRNSTASTISIMEEQLPWNDRSALDIEAQVITNGKTMPVRCLHGQKQFKTAAVIGPGEVRSGAVELSELIGDFESLSEQGDVVLRLAVCTPPRIGAARFIGQPVIVILPQRDLLRNDRHPVVIHFQAVI